VAREIVRFDVVHADGRADTVDLETVLSVIEEVRVLTTRDRDERDRRNTLARRALGISVQQCGRSKFSQNYVSIFVLPTKELEKCAETVIARYCAVRGCKKRECDSRGVLDRRASSTNFALLKANDVFFRTLA